MGKFSYLVIHCADTPDWMDVTKAMLKEWHMGPCNQKDGTVKYLGRIYSSRDELPEQFINGKPINALHGRGWDRLGYTVLIHRDGTRETITPHNDDDVITSDEMTWGAVGVNSKSRHICLAGGKIPKGNAAPMEFEELFTFEQYTALAEEVNKTIELHPNIRVGGHYHFTDEKKCPNISVEKFMASINKESWCYKNH